VTRNECFGPRLISSPPVGKIKLLMLLCVYVVFLICFKSNHVQIHKSTPFLINFS